MSVDTTRGDPIVGVIGAGTMGRGIAQVAAVGGCAVKLFDADATAAKNAVGFIGGMLDRAVERGRMEAADAETARGKHRDRGLGRWLGAMCRRHRSGRRGPGSQAASVRGARDGRGRGRDPGHQHVVPLRHAHRGVVPETGTDRRNALLQPGAVDAARRSDRGRAHRPRGCGDPGRSRRTHGPGSRSGSATRPAFSSTRSGAGSPSSRRTSSRTASPAGTTSTVSCARASGSAWDRSSSWISRRSTPLIRRPR